MMETRLHDSNTIGTFLKITEWWPMNNTKCELYWLRLNRVVYFYRYIITNLMIE